MKRTVKCVVCGATEEREVLRDVILGETREITVSECQNCARSSISPAALVEKMLAVVQQLEELSELAELYPNILIRKHINETKRRFKRSASHAMSRVARLSIIVERLYAKPYAQDVTNEDESIPVRATLTGS